MGWFNSIDDDFIKMMVVLILAGSVVGVACAVSAPWWQHDYVIERMEACDRMCGMARATYDNGKCTCEGD